ncbi:MAG TPA: NEW3 domain-containing protein [Thermoanaerobaculia bacterium]|nr:NEW3 domain-containing protein [Thermoanaerobaculia bacterium]
MLLSGNPRAKPRFSLVPVLRILAVVSLAAFLSGSSKPLAAADSASSRDSVAPGAAEAGNGTAVAGPSVPVDVEGDVSLLVQDFSGGASRRIIALETESGHFELSFAGPAPNLKTGARVRVRGTRTDGRISVEAGGFQAVAQPGASLEAAEAVTAVAAVTGAQKTAVLLVNFSDNTAQPYTKAAIQTMVFTNTSNFDLENSYGQTWLTGDVYGYYTIAQSSTVCDYPTTATLARNAATAAGVNLDNYTHHVIAFPSNACGWWGMGTVGGAPSTAWINGDVEVQVVSHEMGHNFGLDHSHSLECGTVSICTNGTVDEYGDIFDTMGSSTYHFSAAQKERLGWLNAGASPPIKTVTATGTYTLEAYETNGTGFKALKIPVGTTGLYYYVEMRRPTGVDAGLASNTNVVSGVLVHQCDPTDSNSNDLLDMTPADNSFTNAALDTGLSFTDSTAKITIAPVSVGTTGTVNVTIGSAPTCVRANPTVALSPSQSASVGAGTAVAFTLSVTNNDSSVCSSSVFDLTDVVPAGWTGSYSAASLALAPSASGNATLTVTSPSTATSGSYAVSATAENHGATSYTATAAATYVVAASCGRANPTVVASPSTATAAAGSAVAYTVTVTNNDSTACSSSIFDMTDTVSSGWGGSYSASALTISPGASASTTLTVTSPSGTANASYGIIATAKNRGATSYAQSGTATYVVSTPCTRANPVVSLSPAQSGGPAGTSVAFTLSVTNADNSSCAAASFSLSKTVPSNWTGTFSPTSLSLAPGASGTATLTVKSPTSAAGGSYGVTATAKNGAASSFLSTASATYVVSNPCVRANPTVSLSPSQSAGVASGTAVAFTLSVTNADNASCTASSFTVTDAVPAGWAGSVSPASVSLAPGASGTATLTVTSPASAANGSYAVSATAKNAGATSFTSTASATYVVSNPCVRANPTVSLSPAQSAGVAAGTTVAFTLSVTNADNSFCTTSSFALTSVLPSGWTGTFSPTSMSLAPGATGTATLSVKSASTAAPGSYGVSATAKNSSATSFTSTDTATYVVANPCVRANPSVSLSPGQSAGLVAGTAAAFTLSVTNNDNAACNASSFTLSNAVPTGWSAASAASLTVSPGATSTASLTVTSPVSAVNGSYALSVTAKNSAATSYAATASAVYFVLNPVCVRYNPTVSLSPGTSPGTISGADASFTVTVVNNDTAPCSASSFDLSASVLDGWVSSLSTSPLALAPGASGTSTLTVTSPFGTPDGTYAVMASASNSTVSGYSGAGTASCLVSSVASALGAFSDDFNRADSASLGSRWGQVGGSFVVSGNMAKTSLGAAGDSSAVLAMLSGATQTVEADFTSVDNNMGPRFGVILRYQDSHNYYLIYRQTGGSSRLLISKVVNGVETILKAVSISNPTKLVAFHIRGTASGTTLGLDLDGVNKVTVTDSTFASGRVGILIGNKLTTVQQQSDNFAATVQ